jgi:hypothetical protein
MIPMRIARFKMTRAARADATWLRDTLNRESRAFGFHTTLHEDGGLELRRDAAS